MAQQTTIFSKIGKVMSMVHRVPKNGYNSFHKYAYATESDLTESIRPILTEAGLAFFSSVIEQERDGEFTKVKMEFTLGDMETGEVLKACYWGEGQDKGDKGLYKAYTGATKYFLMKTFLIPTGDDPEADTSVDERNSKVLEYKQPPKSSMKPEDAAKIVLSFGKHKGRTLKDLYINEKSYLEWLAKQEKTDPGIKKAITVMFEAASNHQHHKQQQQPPQEPPMTFDGVEIDNSQLPFNM